MERVILLAQLNIDRMADGLLLVALFLFASLALSFFLGIWLLVRGLRQKKRGSAIIGAVLLSLPLAYSLASLFISNERERAAVEVTSTAHDAALDDLKARQKALDAEMRAPTP